MIRRCHQAPLEPAARSEKDVPVAQKSPLQKPGSAEMSRTELD